MGCVKALKIRHSVLFGLIKWSTEGDHRWSNTITRKGRDSFGMEQTCYKCGVLSDCRLTSREMWKLGLDPREFGYANTPIHKAENRYDKRQYWYKDYDYDRDRDYGAPDTTHRQRILDYLEEEEKHKI